MTFGRRPKLEPSKLADRHPQLRTRCTKIEWNHIVQEAKWEDKRGLIALRNGYRTKFDLGKNDLEFLDDIIESQRFTGEFYTASDGTEHTLLDGHTAIREIHDADTEELRCAGLIELPHVNGEPTRTILKRRYWSATAAARDISSDRVEYRKPTTGPHRGDPGEKIAHAVGVRLGVRYAQAMAAEMRHRDIDDLPYSVSAYDSSVSSIGVPDVALRFEPNEPTFMYLMEVKTLVKSNGSNLTTAARMLGSITSGMKVWIVPNRAVGAELLNALVTADFFKPAPKYGPATTNHSLESLNNRINAGDVTLSTEGHVIWKLETYDSLYHYLRVRRPSLFDPQLRWVKREAERRGEGVPCPAGLEKADRWRGTELDEYWPTLVDEDELAAEKRQRREEFWKKSSRR